MKEKINSNSLLMLKNVSLSFAVKGGALIISLLTTPAYIRYFNDDIQLGVWFTILSVLSWMLTCDMGIGNGLRNKLVLAIVEKDSKKMKELISSAYIFLSLIGGLILVIVLSLGSVVKWNRLFHVDTSIIEQDTLSAVVLILVASIVIQFVLRNIVSILYALQMAFLPGLITLSTNVILLLYVLVCNQTNIFHNIVTLAICYFFSVNAPLIIATIWVFNRQLRLCRPSIKNYSSPMGREILTVGSVFLWLQLISLVVDNTNIFLVNAFIGNAAVVEYQIYYRIFSLPSTLVSLLSSSIWSILTKAKAEGNADWIWRVFWLFLLVGLVLSAGEFLIIPFLQLVFDIWLGESSITVDFPLALVFGLSGAVALWRTIVATFSNGLGELKIQSWAMTFGAIVNFPVAWLLSTVNRSCAAIVIANIISMVPYCIVQTAWFAFRLKPVRYR